MPSRIDHSRGVTTALLVRPAILLIRTYQTVLRPLLIGSCKFCPSCSDYAIEALRLHGLWRGGLLALRRLLRCHPFSPGGIDPVPDFAPGEMEEP
jgi:putative membrane protein insertion efficiency factor